MSRNFKSRFTENVRKVGELLEENGYAVETYNAAFKDADGFKASAHSKNMDKALEQTLEEMRNEDLFYARVNGTRLSQAYNGELTPERLIFSLIQGGIEVEEPGVDISGQKPVKAESLSKEESFLPAFGIVIKYRPEFPQDHWEIKATSINKPYTQEEAEKEVKTIKKILEQNGLNVKKAQIN